MIKIKHDINHCISETQLQASKIQIKQFGGKGLKLYQLWIMFIKGTDKVYECYSCGFITSCVISF